MQNKELVERPIILFDGVCNLCSSAVQWIIEHDKKEVFLFCSLQSKTGEQLIKENALPIEADSVILIQNGKSYLRSSAALRIAKQCTGVWKMLWIFMVIPKVLRDFIYNFIAKNRYSWFGKKEVCWMPEERFNRRFLN